MQLLFLFLQPLIIVILTKKKNNSKWYKISNIENNILYVTKLNSSISSGCYVTTTYHVTPYYWTKHSTTNKAHLPLALHYTHTYSKSFSFSRTFRLYYFIILYCCVITNGYHLIICYLLFRSPIENMHTVHSIFLYKVL